MVSASKYRIAFLLAALTAAVLGCASPGGKHAAREKTGPNVVLIVADALRDDALAPATMPHMSEFAARGTRFSTAVANAPWTVPSTGSILTGMYPMEHGVMLDPWKKYQTPLDGQYPTTAEILGGRGYSTAAFVANQWLLPYLGFSRGFDVYDTTYNKAPASELNAKALEWIAAAGDSKPFFLYLHYMETHAPYMPGAEWLAKVKGTGGEHRQLTREEYGLYRSWGMPPYGDGIDLAELRESYNASAMELDEQINLFLKKLYAISPPEDTLVIFTADHGEAFYEHGYPEHGYTFFDEEMLVPLVFVMDGTVPAGKTVSEQVRLIDVAPTVMELAGGDELTTGISGASLTPALGQKPYPSSINTPGSWAACSISGPYRVARRDAASLLVYYPGGERPLELYDLENDPQQMKNITGSSPLTGKYLVEYNNRFPGDYERFLKISGETPAMSPEQADTLKSTGYIK